MNTINITPYIRVYHIYLPRLALPQRHQRDKPRAGSVPTIVNCQEQRASGWGFSFIAWSLVLCPFLMGAVKSLNRCSDSGGGPLYCCSIYFLQQDPFSLPYGPERTILPAQQLPGGGAVWDPGSHETWCIEKVCLESTLTSGFWVPTPSPQIFWARSLIRARIHDADGQRDHEPIESALCLFYHGRPLLLSLKGRVGVQRIYLWQCSPLTFLFRRYLLWDWIVFVLAIIIRTLHKVSWMNVY